MKIMVIGTFDVDNYGDCLFPDILKNELQRRIDNCELHLYSPTCKVAKIGNYNKVYELPGTIEECEKLEYDASILAGGEVLNSGHNPKGIYCFIKPMTMSAGMRLWMTPSILKAKKGTPYAINGVGVGSFDNEIAKGLESSIDYADYKSLRDDNSLKKLMDAHIKPNISINTDSAFLLPNLHSTKEWENIAKQNLPEGIIPYSYIVVQGRLQYLKNNFEIWCQSIKKISESSGYPILLLPICLHHSDHIGVKKIYKKLQKLKIETYKIEQFLKTDVTAAIIACSNGYCGTSLHGSITAVAFEKPLAVFAQLGGKYDGVLENIGIKNCVTDNFEKLPKCFDISSKLDRTIPAQKGKAMASKAFDNIANIFNTKPNKNKINNDKWDNIVNAINFDQSYYKNTKFSYQLRFFFMLIRGSKMLNGIYDNFSAWKNKSWKY